MMSLSFIKLVTDVVNAGGSYAEAQTATIKQWSDPFHFIVYLFVLFVGMVVYYQWKWTKEADKNVDILVVKADGHSSYELVPLDGGSVSLENPKTGKVKLWPINELTTITVPYPGVAFIPRFLQKEIRMVVLTEEDWEPITNRSPHRTNVVSPDVVEKLQRIINEGHAKGDDLTDADKKKLTAIEEMLTEIAANASTYPTRELIASPSVLGNLMHERVTEIVAALGSGLMSKIEEVVKQLTRMGKPVNAMAVYIMLGACMIASIAGIWLSISAQGNMQEDMSKVKNALGIIEMPPPGQYQLTPTPSAPIGQ